MHTILTLISFTCNFHLLPVHLMDYIICKITYFGICQTFLWYALHRQCIRLHPPCFITDHKDQDLCRSSSLVSCQSLNESDKSLSDNPKLIWDILNCPNRVIILNFYNQESNITTQFSPYVIEFLELLYLPCHLFTLLCMCQFLRVQIICITEL